MAQTRTAKGTAAAKTSGTTLTIPDIAMVGGDSISACVAWDSSVSANPTVLYAGKELDTVVGETMVATWRIRIYEAIINNTRTKDLVATFPTANTAKLMIASSLHQAGAQNIEDSNENLAATISTCGPNTPIDHITTLVHAFHFSNGPLGDAIGSSTTGCTLGQRTGTTGGDADTNLTVQETYKIIVAAVVTAATGFTVDDVYQIKTVGTTDFTAIGAASNTVGVVFTATGAGSGTGDAYHLEDARSRLTGLALRDHMGVISFYRPKQTFTIEQMVQYHRNVNQNPDWIMILVKDESGRGFWTRIDPDHFDDWSDALVAEYISKISSIWTTNHVDNNLVYTADTVRDARMATFINDQVII